MRISKRGQSLLDLAEPIQQSYADFTLCSQILYTRLPLGSASRHLRRLHCWLPELLPITTLEFTTYFETSGTTGSEHTSCDCLGLEEVLKREKKKKREYI